MLPSHADLASDSLSHIISPSHTRPSCVTSRKITTSTHHVSIPARTSSRRQPTAADVTRVPRALTSGTSSSTANVLSARATNEGSRPRSLLLALLITEVTLIDSGDRLTVEPTQPLFGFNMATRLGIRIFFFTLALNRHLSRSFPMAPFGEAFRSDFLNAPIRHRLAPYIQFPST